MNTISEHSRVEDMENLLGKWKLKENIRFSQFLSFTQLPWYQIQVANYSSIELQLSKISDMKYSKKVESVFYNVDHIININNTYKECNDGKKIKYNIKNNTIITDIIGTIVNWQEIISYKQPHLEIEYVWKEVDEEGNSTTKTAKQIFESKTD